MTAGRLFNASRATLGSKLRRLARTAVDPNLLAPWKVPAAWATGTTYKVGDVVLANSYWWVCQGAGTSAGAGSGPNTPDAVNVVVDNTVNWLLLGAPTASADDAQAPTLTTASTVPGSPGNVPWGLGVSSSAAMVRLYGGRQISSLTDRWRIATFDRSASSTERTSGGRIGFWCDEATLTLFTGAITGSEGPYRLLVDGRYLTMGGLGDATNVYLTIAWGVRKARYYEFIPLSREGSFATLRLIYTTSAGNVWAPSTESDVRVYWISDSQSAGHSFGSYAPGAGLPFRVARKLDWSDLWNASIGGTGWTNAIGRA